MFSTHATLDAASVDRKARLAKLASLKRKQPEPDTTGATDDNPTRSQSENGTDVSTSVTKAYFSGRNYDPEIRGPKLGFENAPTTGVITLEEKAHELSEKAREQAAKEEEEAEKAGIDLFKLQPKKANWDLKRDLDKKKEILNVKTQNAIARLVRERIQNAKKEAKSRQKTDLQPQVDKEGEEMGIEGSTLVEGINLREQEEREEERKERELDDEGPI
ncbi:putative coiled-coil domain-containing [Phaeomoniella chlamydospora]|uniref:Putative coiled-coil domain-containing n=1 Tax=Phaeomoniella chlamydospora TaxID=158046 RepID=A0A0G2GKD8_PHACM|nr:putative coiled-coil domain-containing [Phaeomoniella chlamydospora]